MDEARSNVSKEARVRERSEQYAKDLESEIETIKRKHMGRSDTFNAAELSEEIVRLRKEMERKDVEADGNIDRLTALHSHEVGQLKYSLSDTTGRLTETEAEVERLRSQLSVQLEEDDVRDHVYQLQEQLDLLSQRHQLVSEENERLSELNESVSQGGLCGCKRQPFSNLFDCCVAGFRLGKG